MRGILQSFLLLFISCFYTLNSAVAFVFPVNAGPYIEGDLGYARVYSSPAPQPTGTGWGLVGGYQFSSHLASQITFMRYAQNSVSSNNQSITFDLVGLLPIHLTPISLFLKAGLGVANHNTPQPLPNPGNFSQGVVDLSAGFRFEFIHGFSLIGKGEYIPKNSLIPSMYFIGGGLRYTFYFL